MYKLDKLRIELEKMIEYGFPYSKVLKKSQELDKYIVEEMKSINLKRDSKAKFKEKVN